MTQQNLYTLNPDAVNARTFIDKLQLAGVQLSLSCGKAKAGLRTLQGFECLVVWQDLYRKPKQPSHIASNKSSVLWGYNTLWVIVGIKHPPPSPPPPPGCWFCCFFVMVLLICWPIPFTLVLLLVYRFFTGFLPFLPVSYRFLTAYRVSKFWVSELFFYVVSSDSARFVDIFLVVVQVRRLAAEFLRSIRTISLCNYRVGYPARYQSAREESTPTVRTLKRIPAHSSTKSFTECQFTG